MNTRSVPPRTPAGRRQELRDIGVVLAIAIRNLNALGYPPHATEQQESQ